jgi:hypothetical protein
MITQIDPTTAGTVITAIRDILYQDRDTKLLDPNLEWTQDNIEQIAEVLHDHNLVPVEECEASPICIHPQTTS